MPNTATKQPSNVLAWLDQLRSSSHADPELVRRIGAVSDLLSTPDRTARPFLSVLLRTQGRRIEPLKDALLCLVGQTDQDFEVLLLVHDAATDAALEVRAIVDDLPADFAARVSVHEVSGGTRAKPLNVGVTASRGRYLAVFDDDDLLFGNWVEEFHRASGSGDRVLRALVANQEVQPELWARGVDGFRTTSWPKLEFPRSFDQVEHLLVNVSPFMSWAFPRQLFTMFGVRFDEELTVCEDWDVILRGSLLLGVTEVDCLTSIYRRWQRGESSYNVHSSDAWRQSEERVIDRVNGWVLTLPPGSVAELRHLGLLNLAWTRYRYLFNGHELRQPFRAAWLVALPGARLLRRVRNRVRRRR
jgi:glycosyltransferase involved in cell wall biosynthesis